MNSHQTPGTRHRASGTRHRAPGPETMRWVSPFNLKFPGHQGTLPRKISIYDTTLRDGEQMPGVSFSLAEKVAIATRLDQVGIPQIEAGFPVVSAREKEAVRTICDLGLKAKIMCLSRLNRE